MSLVPTIFDDHRWDPWRMFQLIDKHFGRNVHFSDDYLPTAPSYYKPWRSVARNDSIVENKDKFEVNLDVQQFKPNEITVKITGNDTITVEGKHEERPDEHGYTTSHFIRRYVLPNGHDLKGVVSKLSSDGVLSISAPRIERFEGMQRTIPIQHTGLPRAITNKY